MLQQYRVLPIVGVAQQKLHRVVFGQQPNKFHFSQNQGGKRSLALTHGKLGTCETTK